MAKHHPTHAEEVKGGKHSHEHKKHEEKKHKNEAKHHKK